MKLCVLSAAILLTGCASTKTTESILLDLPPNLVRPCTTRTLPPKEPPPTADRQTLANFINKIQLAREADARALADCSARHAKLAEMIKQPKAP